MTQPVDPSSDLFPKDWYKSKTFWWNVLLALYAIGTLISAQAQPLGLPPQTPLWLMIAGGIVNVILRIFFTSAPINGTPAAARMRTAFRQLHAAVVTTVLLLVVLGLALLLSLL